MFDELFKSVGKLLLFLFFCSLILLFNGNTRYHQKVYQVTINNNEIFLRYNERYKSTIVPILLDARTSATGYNNVQTIVNEIDFDKQTMLKIEKFNINYKNNNGSKEGSALFSFSDKYEYKRENIKDSRLIIKRKNNILYDDIYIEDISKYVAEPGRYFFQVYIYEKNNFYTNLTMHMSFNIIVGGGNHE